MRRGQLAAGYRRDRGRGTATTSTRPAAAAEGKCAERTQRSSVGQADVRSLCVRVPHPETARTNPTPELRERTQRRPTSDVATWLPPSNRANGATGGPWPADALSSGPLPPSRPGRGPGASPGRGWCQGSPLPMRVPVELAKADARGRARTNRHDRYKQSPGRPLDPDVRSGKIR
jgi:hypothetical protein